MARQNPQPGELAQVTNDFETFFLPFDASLDLGSRTAYGTTDPAVDLSMVNIRHLNNTRGFRGIWNSAPSDGMFLNDRGVEEPLVVPYQENQVVVGSNNVIYQRTDMNAGTNPNPTDTVANTGEWRALGTQLTVNRVVDTMTTGGPGLVNTSTTPGIVNLQFRGYTAGNGVAIEPDGEIRVTNFSLTDVHTFATATLRNNANNITWHEGDVAIVMTNNDPVTVNSLTQGQGTYVYTGTNQEETDPDRTTNNADWTILALPNEVVTRIGTRTGPVEIAQIIGDINTASSQILTDTEYTANAYKFTGAGDPPTSGLTPTPTTGDIYVDTDNMGTLWFYDEDTWRTAAPQRLVQIGDVYLTNPTTDQHLVYSADAGGTGVAGWHNQNATQISGRQIPLEALMDVTVSSIAANNILIRNGDNDAWINISPQDFARMHIPLGDLQDTVIDAASNNQLMRWDGSARNNAGAWVNVNPSDVGNTITFSDLMDIPTEPTTGNTRSLLWTPATGWSYEEHNLNSLVGVDVAAPNAADVLARNPGNTEWVAQDIATTATEHLDLNNLRDVDGNPGPDDVLVRNLGDTDWIPAKINNANLANPTGVETGGRRILIYNQSTNSWAYVSPEEQAIGSIFDIGDVRHRQDLTPSMFSLPTGNLEDARITSLQVNDAESGGPIDSTAIIQFEPGADLSQLTMGDIIGFVNATNSERAHNGNEGYRVDTIDMAGNSIVISDPSGDNIPATARNNIGNPISGGPKFVFKFVQTGLMPEDVIGGELLSFNASAPQGGMWENNTPGELGLVNRIHVGAIDDTDPNNFMTDNDHTQSVTIQNAQAFIEDATIDRAGAMSNTDKDKLDHIPEAPQTANGMPISATNPAIPLGQTDHYALSVERTSTTGTRDDQYEETWVNISDIVTSGGSRLRWTEATNAEGLATSTSLTGYLDNQNMERTVVGTDASGTNLVLTLGIFNPVLLPGTANRSWDNSINSFSVGVQNPQGVDEFLNDINSISFTNNPTLDINDFGPTVFTPAVPPSANTPWSGSRTLTTGTILAPSTGASGGTTVGTVGFSRNDGQSFTDTTTYTITWSGVSANQATATFVGGNTYNFYERRNQITIRQNISGLRTAANGSITWIRGAGLSGGSSSSSGNTSLSQTYTLDVPVYKDLRQIASDATVSTTVNATRPAEVTGTRYTEALRTAGEDSTRPTLGAPIVPYFRLTIDDTTSPSAYGTGTGAILSNNFTGTGLTLNTGVTRVNPVLSNLNFNGTVPNDTFFWFGLPSSVSQPTFSLAQPLPVTPTLVSPNVTVAFDNSFTNSPAGWETVTYTFYGFRVSAGQATITVT